jgi:hypothetical protein
MYAGRRPMKYRAHFQCVLVGEVLSAPPKYIGKH